jgi:hypothetical protein
MNLLHVISKIQPAIVAVADPHAISKIQPVVQDPHAISKIQPVVQDPHAISKIQPVTPGDVIQTIQRVIRIMKFVIMVVEMMMVTDLEIQ